MKKNTVKHLIKKLLKIENQDLEVHLEGCDCFQNWNGKIEIDDEDYLLLKNDEPR